MNKLNTLRDEKAEELYEKLSTGEEDLSEIGIFNKGWDAHEALNLPVLFALYVRQEDVGEPDAELYDYWINNIYTP